MSRIIVISDGIEKIFELTDKNVSIGRHSNNDIILTDVKASRNHAVISHQNNGYVLTDLNSTNGVLVNNIRVSKKVLENGDEIMIGDTVIIYNLSNRYDKVIADIVKSKKSVSQKEKVDLSKKVELTDERIATLLKYVESADTISKDTMLKGLSKITVMMDNIKKDLVKVEKSYKAQFTLNKIGRHVNSVYDLNELLNFIIEMVLKVMSAERGFIMLYDVEKDELVPNVARNMKQRINPEDFNISTSIAKKVFDTGEPILTTDAQHDPRFQAGASIMNFSIRSVMCAPLTSMEEVIGVIYIDNRQTSGVFGNEELDFLTGIASQCAISLERAKLYSDLEESYLASINVLANVLDASDAYTHGHSIRVTEFSMAIAREMGLNEQEVKEIQYGSLLHDIGKVAIKKDVLNKKGRLTDEEYEHIKTHPVKGYEILAPIKFLEKKMDIIKYHHEKYDGTGYPEGLKKDEIPLGARICAVADTYDAMTSTRSYRKALPKRVAMEEIENCSGTQFDPDVVEAFKKVDKTGKIDEIMELSQIEATLE